MAELSVEQQKAMAVARARAQAAASSDKSYTGQILPISIDAQGNRHFDSNAGILGAFKDAFTYANDAMEGRVDPTSEEGIGRALNFATVFSGASPSIRAGEKIVPGVSKSLVKNVEPPTAAELKAVGNQGYENLRAIDAQYSSQSISDMAAQAEIKLAQQGINEKTAPNTVSTLRELQSPPEGGFATASDLETIRRTFSKIGEDFSNPTDQGAGKSVRGTVDSFFASPPPGSVVSGTEEAAAQAAATAANARANWAAGKRSGRLTDILTAAEDRAGATYSGQNLGNALRQRAADILKSDKLSSGFAKNELAALREVARGTAGVNSARFVGKFLGGGGGLGMNVAAATGGTLAAVGTGNPWMAMAGAVPPIIGSASTKIANVLAKRGFEAVEKGTRKRSPLYEAMLSQAPAEAQMPTKTAALIRALLLSQQQGNGGGGW